MKKCFIKRLLFAYTPNNISKRRKDFKDLKCVKFQTEKYMSQAFIIFFHEGSSIIQGIVQKKKLSICMERYWVIM